MARGFKRNGDSSSSRPMDDDDDTVYVAVGNDINESMPTLLWVLENFGGRLCIIHVHQHPPRRGSFDGQIPHAERLKVERLLNEYLQICVNAEVLADKVYIEMDDVAKGIVELIFRNGIKKLVMGAAPNTNFNGEMTRLKSRKAAHVCEKAPSGCEVWFICGGRLIHKRERNLGACGQEETSPTSVVETGFLNPRSPFVDSGPSSSEVLGNVTSMSRERTVEENFGQLIRQLERAVLDADESKQKAYKESVKHHEAAKTAVDTIHWATEAYNKELKCRREIEEALTKKDEELKELRKELDRERLTARDHKSVLLNQIATSEIEMKKTSDELLSTKEMVECCKKECEDMMIERDNAIKMVEEIAMNHTEEASSSQQSNSFFSEAYNKELKCRREIEEALTKKDEELKELRKELDRERLTARDHKSVLLNQIATSEIEMKKTSDELLSTKEMVECCKKECEDMMIERDNAIKMVEEIAMNHTNSQATEAYNKELKCRREIEEALTKKDEELKELRKELDRERLTARDHKSVLLNQIATSEIEMKKTSDELLSTKEMVECCKKECEDMMIERDNAIKMVEEIAMNHTEEASSSQQSNSFFSEFSVSDIHQATRGYDRSMKINDGGNGSIYIGSLRKTDVVVKTLLQNGWQGTSHFQEEVDLLSKLRHPNLVTFVGACPDILAIVYEYLPNGSLEDKLSSQENPLSWQNRISIATDLCSVLIFLHSSDPCTIHGNLKPGNILLDANFSCKLSDFGICRAHTLCVNLPSNADPRRAYPYLDPNFFETRVLSPKTDIYSFGIILLQLLTGKAPHNVAADVQKALQDDCLQALLDPSAGDWPYLQARQLAFLALRCCDETQGRRPDLDLDMWTVLKRMRDSCEAQMSSFRPGIGDPSQPPSSFTCPISQDVMEHPHMAADGFTYEYASIKRWFDDHNTSPMTNLPLEHLDLLPNHAIRTAIQEWQERQ